MTLNFNRQQRMAVEHSGSHALVLAGAGTGKTATIIGHAAHLLRQGVEARRILLVTFTRRAASEMIHRLGRDADAAAPRVEAGTFHHFCLRTMQSIPDAFGLRNVTVMDRDDQLQLIKLVRAPLRRKGENFPPAGRIMSTISYARNTNRSFRDYLGDNADLFGWEDDVVERMLQIAGNYRKRKEARGYLDFDDLLYRFAARLHRNEEVKKRVKGRYDHILVDEMQDTNPLQWLVLDALRDPPQLFCVGDDAQSIYAFRGADFQNVHQFTKRVSGATVLKLEENYRSLQGILDLANWLLDESPLKYDKQLRSARDAVASPPSAAPASGRPRLLDFEDEFGEADWIAKDLVERHQRGAGWRDHMIITRTAYAARALEAALTERKVPYQFIGGTQLFQAAHVRDLLSLVRAGLSNQDDLAWMRYLTLWRGIGDVGAAQAIEKILPHPDVGKALDVLLNEWSGAPEILHGVRAIWLHQGPPSKIIRDAVKFLDDLLRQRYENWDRRKRDLDLLSRLASGHHSMQSFLETYALDPMSVVDASRQGGGRCCDPDHRAFGQRHRSACLLLVESPVRHVSPCSQLRQ